jgi:hypothetical protein
MLRFQLGCFFCVITNAQLEPPRKPLTLDSDHAVHMARRAHPWLVLMLQTSYDEACNTARPYFVRVAESWAQNVSFGILDAEQAPQTTKQLRTSLTELPAFGLFISGMDAPVRYRGGWSERSISKWLSQQSAVIRPVELDSASQLEELVRVQVDGLAVLGLLPPRLRSRLEAVARGLELQMPIAFANEALASEIGAPFPSVLVTHGDDPWALLSAPARVNAIEEFLRRRALPIVAPVGDSNRRYAKSVREHPARLQAICVHRSGAQGAHEPSESTLTEVRAVTSRFGGVALFVSHDFFDNDPDQIAHFGLYESDLPALVVVSNRGGFEERTWKISGDGKHIGAERISSLLQRAVTESGVPSAAPGGWETLSVPACQSKQ